MMSRAPARHIKRLPIEQKIQMMEALSEDLRERFERSEIPESVKRLLDRNFHIVFVVKPRPDPYFTRGLRSSLIFLRVPTMTFASGTLVGSVNPSASSSSFCPTLGWGT